MTHAADRQCGPRETHFNLRAFPNALLLQDQHVQWENHHKYSIVYSERSGRIWWPAIVWTFVSCRKMSGSGTGFIYHALRRLPGFSCSFQIQFNASLFFVLCSPFEHVHVLRISGVSLSNGRALKATQLCVIFKRLMSDDLRHDKVE